MERIKKAIEKVNKQHLGGADRLIQWHPVVQFQKTQTQNELEKIDYTHTRVTDLQLDHLEKNRIVAFNKNDAMSMNFDLLRTQVLQKMVENNWRTLAITSPTPQAGKTVVAINLAMSIAQQTNKTAMLVDFDLRRPRIGAYLGIQMEKSLNDLLHGTADLPEVLVNPGIPRLVVLAPQNSVKKSSEMLSSQKIADLIKDLRERYESRIVIFDLPPVLIIDDALALLPQVDCILMVVANGMSTKLEIEESLQHIPAAKLIGTIFNKAEIMPMDYYS